LSEDSAERLSEAAGDPSVNGGFAVGDRVRVDLEVEIFQALQEGHGGFFDKMKKVIL